MQKHVYPMKVPMSEFNTGDVSAGVPDYVRGSTRQQVAESPGP